MAWATTLTRDRLLIEHRLDFEKDWMHGNDSFTMGRLDANGHVLPAGIHAARDTSTIIGPSARRFYGRLFFS